MIITQTVRIKLTSNNVKYYESLGYNIPKRQGTLSYQKKYHKEYIYDIGSEIEVNVSDLPINSNTKIEVQCDNDNCKHKHILMYSKYNKNITKNNGVYYCRDCWNERLKKIIQEKYHVDNVSQSQEIKNKKTLSMLKHYGVQYPFQSKVLYSHMQDVVEQKYGTRNPSSVDEYKEKRKNTNLLRYGYENPQQSPDIHKKTQQTIMQKYGVDNVSQSKDIQNKKRHTMYQNSTVATSRQQYSIYKTISSIYLQTKLNYPIGQSFSGDIVIDNIDFEVDYGGHNLSVKKGQITQEEFDKNQIIRDKIIKSEGYKIVRLIANKERKIPSEEKILEILESSIQYFASYPEHTWREYYIEQGIYRDAEHKDGESYDYGELTKIK